MGDVVSLILIIAAVVLVLYLSYLFSRYISKRSGKINNQAEYMKVVDRLPVGQDRFLLIVEIQGAYYLVSATAHEIRILKELDGFEELMPPPVDSRGFGASFKSTLESMTSRKKQ